MPKKSAGKSGRKKATAAKSGGKRAGHAPAEVRADSYDHPEAQLANRPEIGTQAGFSVKFGSNFQPFVRKRDGYG